MMLLPPAAVSTAGARIMSISGAWRDKTRQGCELMLAFSGAYLEVDAYVA